MAEKSAPTKRLRGPGNGKTPAASGPTVTKAQAFQRDLEKLREKYGDDYVVLQNKDAVAPGSSALAQPPPGGPDAFPVRLFPHDKDDNLIDLKMKADPAVLGAKTLTTKDLEWLQRKQEAQNAAQFKLYAAQLFDSKNPAELQILNQIMPDLLQEKYEIVDRRAELDARLAKMRLRGFPRDQEDLQLAFAIKSGQVELPEGTLWKPDEWKSKNDVSQKLSRGIFSPLTRLTKTQYDTQLSPWDLVAPGTANTSIEPQRYTRGEQ